MTLAEEMAVTVEADPEHRQELISAALAVGQWLADEGRPGRWDCIETDAALRVMALPDEQQESGFLLALTGLIGFEALRGYLPTVPARRTLLQIEVLARNPVITRYAANTAAQLQSWSA